ncbi:hypothetical protein M408DRAFT_328389 [Serendipita vermifera MAFF 305830]|uniref:Wax synthase domain-containing protein n=1 Tax=Serendipita vermifera MAFF 305830 TaxID=933852 RepID=A0A0C3AZH2_SERVB|nr:hypothetical protein M408DRAFT_328389 [Serendipita vermifera MAFF 305830]
MKYSDYMEQDTINEVLWIWRQIVPRPRDRVPVTIYTIHNVFLPLVPLLFMAYLVRRPNTHFARLAVMPFTIWTILRASFGFVWVDQMYSPYNFGQGLFGIASVGKALEYGFVKEGRFKNGEGSLGHVTTPAIDRVTANKPSAMSTLGLGTSPSTTPTSEKDLSFPNPKYVRSPSGVALAVVSDKKPPGNRKAIRSPSGVTLAYRESHTPRPNTPISNGHAAITSIHPKKSSSPLRGLADAIEVLGSVRGIGWSWGKGLYIAPETRPLDRAGFVTATLKLFIFSFLALDFLESAIKLLPPFRKPSGGTIFYMTEMPSFLADDTILSPLIKSHPVASGLIAKYFMSTVISFAIGLAIIAGFEMCYALLTLICVGLLGHNPESWPPIFDHPWRATSLADFWGRRWHQTLRLTFFIFGGYPAQFIIETLLRPVLGKERAVKVGRIGLVLGTFTASGLFHGLSIYGMGEGGVDHTATLYFASQGVLLLAERVWRIVTGKRVQGVLGRIWTYAAVLIGIEFCMDGWSKRGLASGLIIPPILSPTRMLLWPILIRLME